MSSRRRVMGDKFKDGVWPVMLTPFTDNNQVDYDALGKLVDWYIENGVAGLFADCQSSEMFFLTLEDRVQIARFVKERADGRVSVVASGIHGPEDVGMAVDQLPGHAVHHVVHGEAAPLRLDLGVEGHLHQYVAQLLAHVRRVVPVDGVQSLIRLLQEVPADGPVGLLRVPGAAPRGPEQAHNLQEILPAVTALTLKIYHRLPAFARNFEKKVEMWVYFLPIFRIF